MVFDLGGDGLIAHLRTRFENALRVTGRRA